MEATQSVKAILDHLDFLRAIAVIPIDVIEFTLERLAEAFMQSKQSPSVAIRTHWWLLEDARHLFPPEHASILCKLSAILVSREIKDRHGVDGFYVLDVLTSIVVIGKGDVLRKSSYIFRWYNVSQSGHITEMELSICIKRACDCFAKLKLLGDIDITDADARHLAMNARLVKKSDTKAMTFMPYLNAEDFDRWYIEQNKVVMLFVDSIQRLTETLVSLRNKASTFTKLIEEKQKFENGTSIGILRLQDLQCIEDPTPVSVIHRGRHSISLVIPRIKQCDRNNYLYVLCEKVITIPRKFYTAAKNLFRGDNVGDGSKLLTPENGYTVAAETDPAVVENGACCGRYYTLKSYRKFVLDSSDSREVMRIDITELEPDSRYHLTVYTSERKFQTVEANTIPPNSESLVAQQREIGLCIAPPELSGPDILAYFQTKKSRIPLDLVIHTGSLCPIDELLERALPLLDTSMGVSSTPVRVASGVSGAVSGHYSAEWRSAVEKLFVRCSPYQHAVGRDQFIRGHNGPQVVAFNGQGALSDNASVARLSEVLGPMHLRLLLRQLENTYSSYAATVTPPNGFLSIGPLRVLFVDNSLFSANSERNRKCGMNSRDILRYLITSDEIKKQNDDTKEYGCEAKDAASSAATPMDGFPVTDNNPAPQHLILLTRSPLDIMTPMESWPKIIDRRAPRIVAAPDAEDAGQSYLDQLGIGKSSNIATSSASDYKNFDFEATADDDLKTMLMALFRWKDNDTASSTQLQVGGDETEACDRNVAPKPQQSQSSREVTVVCTNWVGGKNFELLLSRKDSEEVGRIRFECISETADYVAPKPIVSAFVESTLAGSGSGGAIGVVESKEGDTSAAAGSTQLPVPTSDAISASDAKNFAADKLPAVEGDGRNIIAADILMQKIRASLPPGCELRLNPGSPARSFVLTGPAATLVTKCKSMFLTAKEMVGLNNTPAKEMKNKPCETEPERSGVEVVSDPRLLKVTATEATLSVRAKGLGMMTCTLYELPIHATYSDAVSFYEAEKEQLVKVQTMQQRCSSKHRRDYVIKFTDLRPFCNYCVVAEPFAPTAQVPLAQFRSETLVDTCVSSTILVPVREADLSLPSPLMLRLDQLLERQKRLRSAGVHLLPCRGFDGERYGDLRHRVGIRKLFALKAAHKAPVVHTFSWPVPKKVSIRLSTTRVQRTAQPHVDDADESWIDAHMYDPLDAVIDINISGHFCRIAPRDASTVTMDDYLNAFDRVCVRTDVEVITIFVDRPLIAHLRRQRYSRDPIRKLQRGPKVWLWEGFHRSEWLKQKELFRRIFLWKAENDKRDCAFMCFAEVPAVKCVTFTLVKAREVFVDEERDDWSTFPELAFRQIILPSTIGGTADILQFRRRQLYHFPRGRHRMQNGAIEFVVSTVSSIFAPYIDESVYGPLKSAEYRLTDVAAMEPLTIHPNNGVIVKTHQREAYLRKNMLPLEKPEGIIYVVEIVRSPGLKYGHDIREEERSEWSVKMTKGKENLPTPHHSRRDLLRTTRFPASPRPFTTAFVVRSYVHELDLFEIVSGPIVGAVTSDSANILIEVNTSLKYLKCVLKPSFETSETIEPVSAVIKDVEAYRPVVFEIKGLHPGSKYDILLPDVCGTDVLGCVKTVPLAPSYIQIAITGSSSLVGLPMIDTLVEHITRQQSPDINSLAALSRHGFPSDCAMHPLSFASIVAMGPFPGPDDPGSSWNTHAREYYPAHATYKSNSSLHNATSQTSSWVPLSQHMHWPGSSTNLVVHLGPKTLVARNMERVMTALMDLGHRLKLPLRDATGVGILYFRQFEEVIRDTFRLLWTVPAIREVLASGSHIPIFHSDFMLQYQRATDTEGSSQASAAAFLQQEADRRLISIIQKVFRVCLQEYAPALSRWTPASPDHTSVWRSGSTIVIVLDTASTRVVTAPGKKIAEETVSVSDAKNSSKPPAKSASNSSLSKLAASSAGNDEKEGTPPPPPPPAYTLKSPVAAVLEAEAELQLQKAAATFSRPGSAQLLMTSARAIATTTENMNINTGSTGTVGIAMMKSTANETDEASASDAVSATDTIEALNDAAKKEDDPPLSIPVTEHQDDKEEEEEVHPDADGPVGDSSKSVKTNRKGKLSPGFFDPSQWGRIKEMMNDPSILSVVLCTESPIIPLQALSAQYSYPEGLREGDYIPWSPTIDDVADFCQFWFTWLRPHTEVMGSRKSVTLVSAHDVPYATTIEEISSGLRITQTCTGKFGQPAKSASASRTMTTAESTRVRFSENPEDTSNEEAANAVASSAVAADRSSSLGSTVALNGTFGGIRYRHTFSGLDDLAFDASWMASKDRSGVAIRRRYNNPSGTSSGNSVNEGIAHMLDVDYNAGFAVLKLWNDTNRVTSSWSYQPIASMLLSPNQNIAADDPETAVEVPTTNGCLSAVGDDAVLLVGPILGAPAAADNPEVEGRYFSFPVLFELDRPKKVTIELKSWVGNAVQKLEYDVPGRRPFVANIGPLKEQCRYNARFISGVRECGGSFFVLSTHLDEDDSNIAVLNCEPVPNKEPCSDFIYDLANRCKVPFSGVTALVHVNLEPHVKPNFGELLAMHGIEQGLEFCVARGEVTTGFLRAIDTIMEIVRDRYREALTRPTYRDLLAHACNLFMPSKDTATPEEFRECSSFEKLLHLIAARIRQEYLSQVRYTDENVFAAIAPKETVLWSPSDDDGSQEARAVRSKRNILNELVASAPSTQMRQSFDGLGGSSKKEFTGRSVPVDAVSNHDDEGDDFYYETLFEELPDPNGSILEKRHRDEEDYDPVEAHQRAPSEKRRSSVRTASSYAYGFCLGAGKKRVFSTNRTLSAAASVLAQWILDMSPLPAARSWTPWLSPNEKTSVEQVNLDVHVVDVAQSVRSLDYSPVDSGVRVVVLVGSEITEEDEEEERERSQKLMDAEAKLAAELEEAKALEGKKKKKDKDKDKEKEKKTSKKDKDAKLALYSRKNMKQQLEVQAINYAKNGLGNGLDILFHQDLKAALDFQKRGNIWTADRADRNICFIYPSQRNGTRTVPLQALQEPPTMGAPAKAMKTVTINIADSVFRCNEYDRLQHVMRTNGDFIKKEIIRLEGLIATTKKVRTKEKYEIKLREHQMMYQQQQIKWKQDFELFTPDGYYFIECRTPTVEAVPGKKDTISMMHAKVLKSLFGGAAAEEVVYFDPESDRPSPLDYLQIPKWLTKFAGGAGAVFIQDEVLLLMRQDPASRAILDRLEDDHILARIAAVYLSSPLRELSLPQEEWTIDFQQRGVMGMFLRGVMDHVYEELVSDEMRDMMIDLTDDFARSYVLARALADTSSLLDADSFAVAIRYALVLAVALKWCEVEKDKPESRWTTIMEDVDHSVKVAKDVIDRNRAMALAHARAKKWSPKTYDADVVTAEANAAWDELRRLEEADAELEALDRETAEAKLSAQRKMEDQIRSQRLADLDADEDEEIENMITAAKSLVIEDAGEAAAGAGTGAGTGTEGAAGEEGKKAGAGDGEKEFEMPEELKYLITLRDAVRTTVNIVVDKQLDELIRLVILEKQKEKKQEAEEKKVAERELADPWSEAERLNQASDYVVRLGKERVKERRASIERIQYLS